MHCIQLLFLLCLYTKAGTKDPACIVSAITLLKGVTQIVAMIVFALVKLAYVSAIVPENLVDNLELSAMNTGIVPSRLWQLAYRVRPKKKSPKENDNKMVQF